MASVLKKIEKRLKNYFTYPKNDDIIVVSIDKTELPFVYIVEEENELLVSFAVGFSMPDIVASVILEICDLKEVVLVEKFYISNNGNTYWAEEAEKMFEIDNFVDLESIEAVSEELN